MKSCIAGLVLCMVAIASFAVAGEARPLAPDDADVTRLVVKLRADLATAVEGELPVVSLSLSARSAHADAVGQFLRRHGGEALRPVYAGLVRAKKRTGRSERELAMAVRQRFAARSARQVRASTAPTLGNTYILQIPATNPADVEKRLAALRADPVVEYAELDRRAFVASVPNDPFYSSSGTWGQPYDDMYALKKIHAEAAWDTTAGAGVVVAVVDTGLDMTHPDIAANVWTNPGEIPGNGIDDDGNGFVDDVHGWDFDGDFQGQDADPNDLNGHGTHVAGTIAATGNNGVGIVGVAYEAKIMPVQGLDRYGSGYDSNLAAAVQYAAANGADVINNSWSGTGSSPVIADAIAYAHDLGAVIVAAAGDSGEDDGNSYPAGLSDVVTVSSLTPADILSVSNFGRIDVSAPGDDILSLDAWGSFAGLPVGALYARGSGTSMAAPQVSGVAALVIARHPAYTNEQVRQALHVSATDVEAPGYDPRTGYGRVDAAAALAVVDPLEVKIESPAEGALLSGTATTTIAGLARGTGFVSYRLEYGFGTAPSSWTTIGLAGTPVNGGGLGVFNPAGLGGGLYTFRLTATNATTSFVDRVRIRIPDVEPPSVQFTSPAAGSTVTGDVTLAVRVTDNVEVWYVDYYLDGRFYVGGAFSSVPFGALWRSAFWANGTHTLTAKAHDKSGNMGEASITVKSSNTPPVWFLSPAPGAQLSGPVVVEAKAVSDVQLVKFYLDGSFIGQDLHLPPRQNAPTWLFLWITQSATNGTHTLTAKVYSDGWADDVAYGAPLTITTNNGPAVTVTAPSPGARVSGPVTLSAQVASWITAASVSFSVDGEIVGTTSTAPYTIKWDSLIAADGSHTVAAGVTSDVYNGASAPVTFTTANPHIPYDPGLKVPLCDVNTGTCDSGPLLRYMKSAEPNGGPNTLYGSCPDLGYAGSNDRLRVIALDGQPFAAGSTVRIEATERDASSGDFLDLFWTADVAAPSWMPIATFPVYGTGTKVFSATYTIPAGGLQAIRAQRRHAVPGSSACEITDTENTSGAVDHDDLAFVVNGIAPGPESFYTLPPCRLLDTRNVAGTFGAPGLLGGRDRTFPLAGRCGIPATAKALSLNVTITAPTGAGDLRLSPAGQGLPLASVINFAPGQTRANNAIAKLNADRRLSVRNDQAPGATVQFILDVNGYFE